jgi:hypothetical protein
LLPLSVISQEKNTDTLIQNLEQPSTTINDQGVILLKTGKFEDANQFLTNQISKDESDREAYFKRGIANWALSDTLSACRDWSAVLALGDTAMFNLLDSRCHSSMIISDDTIPAKLYRKMWSDKSGAQQNAKTVVEVMPEFPGGEEKLFEYISENIAQFEGQATGTVYINFLISPKGKVLYPYVVRGIGQYHDKEALRLIRNMPDWIPGKQKGKPVYVRSSIPVRF